MEGGGGRGDGPLSSISEHTAVSRQANDETSLASTDSLLRWILKEQRWHQHEERKVALALVDVNISRKES